MKNKIKKTESKKFLGKTEGFKDNNERHFFQRMLRAYLKGKDYFDFGFNLKGEPVKHAVLRNW